MKVEFKTPMGPNFLVISSPPAMAGGGHSVPISSVPAEDLAKIADAWRTDLFRRAGHKDPGLAPVGSEALAEAIEAMEEAVDLFTEIQSGHYMPDNFTAQPLINAVAKLKAAQPAPVRAEWYVDEQNDAEPGDTHCNFWWVVTNGKTVHKCANQKDTSALRDKLNKQPAASAPAQSAEPDANNQNVQTKETTT